MVQWLTCVAKFGHSFPQLWGLSSFNPGVIPTIYMYMYMYTCMYCKMGWVKVIRVGSTVDQLCNVLLYMYMYIIPYSMYCVCIVVCTCTCILYHTVCTVYVLLCNVLSIKSTSTLGSR